MTGDEGERKEQDCVRGGCSFGLDDGGLVMPIVFHSPCCSPFKGGYGFVAPALSSTSTRLSN